MCACVVLVYIVTNFSLATLSEECPYAVGYETTLTPDNLDYYTLCRWACIHINWCHEKHFMFLEELNRTICENGLNFRLLCIYFCKNISQLPGHLIRHSIQCTLLSFWISRIHSATLTTFSGIITPSYVLPSCNSCCLPFPDKNKRKNIVLNQHSVKEQRLSEG